ncbi:MAG: hypothetical protein N2Z69_03550 [Methylophilaceae bacterium]|nr:hypothetical protein [Methylophilaceae bacterium]
MGPNYTLQTSEIRLHSSRQLLAVLTIAHLGAAAALLVVPVPFWLQLSCGLTILASLVHSVRHHAMRQGAGAIVALRTSGRGMEVQTTDGNWLMVEVLGSSLVTPWLTVLHLRPTPHRRRVPLVLLPDMLLPQDYRRLRVWLRWQDAFGHGADDAAML